MTSFWISLLAATGLMFPIMGLLRKLKSRQTISQFVPEHQAKQGTPTMGGLIILAGAIVALAFQTCTSNPPFQTQLVTFLVVIAGFALIGFVDDFVVPKLLVGKRGLGWKQKIVLEALFAVGPLVLLDHSSWLQAFEATVVLLFFANAYNFVDGLDGLAGSVGIVLLFGLSTLAWLTPTAYSGAISAVSLSIIGGTIPFLFLNAPPAKVFMGDVGSMPIGAAIGLMVWHLGSASTSNGLSQLSLLMLSGVMFVALVPVPIQIASVKLRKKRVFLKTPIHHAFQERGIPETRIVSAYLLAQVLLVALAISLPLYGHSLSTIDPQLVRVTTKP
jgi:phospho-N-acetylmuramoyl-pentapeptide-transferase